MASGFHLTWFRRLPLRTTTASAPDDESGGVLKPGASLCAREVPGLASVLIEPRGV
jgi:hypothetical protein